MCKKGKASSIRHVVVHIQYDDEQSLRFLKISVTFDPISTHLSVRDYFALCDISTDVICNIEKCTSISCPFYGKGMNKSLTSCMRRKTAAVSNRS